MRQKLLSNLSRVMEMGKMSSRKNENRQSRKLAEKLVSIFKILSIILPKDSAILAHQ